MAEAFVPWEERGRNSEKNKNHRKTLEKLLRDHFATQCGASSLVDSIGTASL